MKMQTGIGKKFQSKAMGMLNPQMLMQKEDSDDEQMLQSNRQMLD